ncbi:hypothetical protein [Azospirillum griseum]|uniref:Lipoprotein n=1 Tax=Azospirillum griseum TaxID=2496639 RepID=A0A431V9F2_9PROT|nr:hypothetical protein [Azospirillum griseum]RTR11056.1 hypothetical protein EJ903_26225 [Azospirillum griseum]
MRMPIMAAAAALLTSACNTADIRAQAVQQRSQYAVMAAERIDEACASFGFKPGTDAFATCRMVQAEKQAEEQRRWAAAAAAQTEQLRRQNCYAAALNSLYSQNSVANALRDVACMP